MCKAPTSVPRHRWLFPAGALLWLFSGLYAGLSGCAERKGARLPDGGHPGPIGAFRGGASASAGATKALPEDPNERLDLYARENLEAELAFSPSTATWLGMRGYDDRIDDVRQDAQAREVARLRQLVERLRWLEEGELDP